MDTSPIHSQFNQPIRSHDPLSHKDLPSNINTGKPLSHLKIKQPRVVSYRFPTYLIGDQQSMAETKEPEAPAEAEEQTTAQQPPAEEENKEPKAAKEKKPKAVPKEKKPKAAPKEKKPKPAKTASHPPYFQMIKEAIEALKEKSGSSPYAIAKYMEEKHKSVLPGNFRKILALQLKNSAAKGKLLKVKASYKLASSASSSTRPKPEAKEKKPAPAAPRRRTKSVNKPAPEKKPAAGGKRKATAAAATPSKKKPKKSAPAKPKSIKKSPAAKRARK